MEAGLAKIHVPFLYARIFATGHPLLYERTEDIRSYSTKFSAFKTTNGNCASVMVWLRHRFKWGRAKARPYRRMEATLRGSHVRF